jgi:hypothetical protein
MPDELLTELAAAERYETLADGSVPHVPRPFPGAWVPTGGQLGVLPGEDGTCHPVIAHRAGYVVATCYDPRSNRTIVALTPEGDTAVG